MPVSLHKSERRGNYISPQLLREAIANILTLRRLNAWGIVREELWDLWQEQYGRYLRRSIGDELGVREAAQDASKTLGVSFESAESAANDVAFPNRAIFMARKLREFVKLHQGGSK